MSTNDYIHVLGAPDVGMVASVVGLALDSTAVYDGLDSFGLDGPTWYADVYPSNLDTPGEVTVAVWHEGPDLAPLHALTDRVYDHLVLTTKYRLRSSSDDGATYPGRFTAAR